MATRAKRTGKTALTIQTVLFDADNADRPVELTAETVGALADRQLLWVDGEGPADDAAIGDVVTLLPVDGAAITRFLARADEPRLELHGDYFQLRVEAIARVGEDRTTRLDLIAGNNFVVTLHAEPIEFMDDFNDRIEQDTSLGQIDSGDFAVVLLDGLLTGYLRTADELETTVDRLDAEALRPSAVRDLLGEMVALRHRIAAVRRVLASHREVFAALARPDFEIIADAPRSERYANLADRFERAIDAIEGSRESLVGTFDIYATRTSQRTNDIIRILTIVSVLLLPTTVIAGFMGMNIQAPYSNNDPSIFWFVVGGIAAIAAGTLITLRLRHWL